jgi:hypothetical protein
MLKATLFLLAVTIGLSSPVLAGSRGGGGGQNTTPHTSTGSQTGSQGQKKKPAVVGLGMRKSAGSSKGTGAYLSQYKQ